MAIALVMAIACAGCTWLGSREKTYTVSTANGEIVVACEFFGHDGGYWEPTTESTYQFQWVCDAIPDHWGLGVWPPQTVVNPSDPSEVARRARSPE